MNTLNSNITYPMNVTKSNINDLVQTLLKSESIMLSIVIISKGLINSNEINFNSHPSNLESKENIAILNITHTDSYTQDLKNRIESMYELLGAKYIFPIGIWKNNIENTKQSTGNINRHIYNHINQIRNLRVNIMIDNIKQNIPKYNYVISYKIIESLTQELKDMGLEQVYLSESINCLKTNDFTKLSTYIEKICGIKNIIIVQDINMGLCEKQIQYYRQYGIETINNKQNKRKRKLLDMESEISSTNSLNSTNSSNTTNSNNIIELDSFDLNLDLL